MHLLRTGFIFFENSSVTDLSSWGQETNYPLLKRTLEAAGQSVGEGQAVIFDGDILAHKFPETFFQLYGEEDPEALRSFVYKSMVFFSAQVRERLGNVPVMFTLGNNDSYAGDYLLVPGGAFLTDTAELFYNTFLLGQADWETYFSTYSTGGYFVAAPPGAKVLFVCLNSVLFSNHRSEECTDEADNVPGRQLDWLEQVLEKARGNGKKVFLVTHIPTGMSIYSTVRTYMDANGKISDAEVFWKESCQSRFLDICRRYASVIEAIFNGHTHMDEYRLILDRDGDAYKAAIVTPAVSPQYGNNPAFKVLTLRGEDWKPLDYRFVSCDLDLSSRISAPIMFSAKRMPQKSLWRNPWLTFFQNCQSMRVTGNTIRVFSTLDTMMPISSMTERGRPIGVVLEKWTRQPIWNVLTTIDVRCNRHRLFYNPSISVQFNIGMAAFENHLLHPFEVIRQNFMRHFEFSL